MSEPCSYRAMARRLGVAEGVFRKGIRTGRVPGDCLSVVEGRKLVIDPDLVERLWHANRDPGKAGRGDKTIAEVRQRVLEAQARRIELANAVREGQLIERRAAELAAFTSARVARDNILNIPARIAAELASLTDPGQVMTLLDRELRQALGTIAHELGVRPA